MNPPPMLDAFLAAVCFALSAVFAHRTTRLVGVLAANFARLCVAGVMLAAWAHLRGGGLGGRGLPVFVLSGMIGFGMGDLALFAALPLLGSRLTALMVQCLAAPLAACIEWLWLGTKLDTLEMVCGGLILAGVGIAVAPEKPLTAPSTVPASNDLTARARGLLYGFIAALGQGAGAVVSRKAHALSHLAGHPVDGVTAAYQRLLGGLAIVTAAFLLSRRKAPLVKPQWSVAWPWIIGNSLAGATIGVSFYQQALSTTRSGIVLPIVALTPLLVIPFAYVVERERPSLRSLLGGALAVAGAAALACLRNPLTG